jgi:hypothetical protein
MPTLQNIVHVQIFLLLTQEITMSTTVDVGFLTLNAPPKTFQGFMPAVGITHFDIYKFRTGTKTANVSMSSSGPSNPSPFGLALFRDANNNGTLDNVGDALVSGSIVNASSGSINTSLNRNLSQGTYFARFISFAVRDISYTFKISRSDSGANPLANQEIQVGTISQDLTMKNRVNDNDTADNFAFTMDASGSLNINVEELGNKKGDANIRVIRDFNGWKRCCDEGCRL